MDFQEIQPYPNEVMALGTFKGFVAIYFKHLKNTKTNAEAYEYVEMLHKKFYGKRKYANFESFRIVKNRKIKQL